jgi:hypothetical protein
VGFLENWILEGLSGNGKTLDCTATSSFPTAEKCTVFPAPANCATQGKPKELVFKYTGDGCAASNNPQGGKATCSVTGAFEPHQDAAVQAAGSSDLKKDVYTVNPATVAKDGTVTVTFKGSDFKADSYFRLSQGSNRVDLKIHTSCSQALAVGDVFGPLTLVGFNGATNGTPVLYGYELLNKGNPVAVQSIVDDQLGDISDCTPGLPELITGESVRCTQEGTVTTTTTNTVTVNTALANCSATDSLTVTVAPPPAPPAPCSELKPIDGIKLEFDSSLTGGKTINSVQWYRTTVSNLNSPNPADLVGNTGAIENGDVFDFTGFAARNAQNDVDFVVTLSDNSKIRSRFHRSCSDNAMNDIADCGSPQGDGKNNDAGSNIWLLRDLSGNGKVLGCQ